MANAKSYSLGPGLSTAEQVAGFCYLPVYMVLLSVGLQWLSQTLGLNWTDMQLNVVYFVVNCAMVWIIFHNFLIRSLRCIRFWETVQAVILGFCLYYAGNLAFGWIIGLLDLSITSFNDETVLGLFSQNKWVMGICAVGLAPIVEETLVRGLLFGVIRRSSRILAYAVTIVFFSAMHVWQYLMFQDVKEVLLAGLQYIPASIALGWTYEKSNTVWGPILLHMTINAISMGIISIL